ncbi:MAG: hypothetical protein O1I87_04675 [Cylindrospermopsis raciborskii PAMP2012]|nr:hypothetical protein [Cylindrospermopsis raciborskii]MCZ2201225.1 hypothetical protein [Cylindrospermopsis raciborskii PAMP2012]
MNWLGIVSLTLLFPTTIFGLLTNHQEISDKITDYSFWLLPLLAITAIAFILDGYFTGLKAGASIRNAVLFAFIMGYLPTLGIRAFSFSKIAIARTFLPSMFGLVFNIN